MDRIRIIYAPLADYSTARWGVLKVVDGKVTLDKVKAFNRARRMLNVGANTFRVLRRGVWETQVPFDFEDDGYWPMFREWLTILHQPYQKQGAGVGAEVWVDIFDGCSETWMYDDHARARKLIRLMFFHLGDLSWVKFRTGNEMNQAQAVDFVKDVAYPEFKSHGRFPANYGACYSDKEDRLEAQKGFADRLWDTETTKVIFRDVHGVKDENSKGLQETFRMWAKKGNPIRVIWSVDGVFDGANPCDWTITNGKVRRRPSVDEWKSAVRFILDNARRMEIPNPIDTKLKYGFEYLPKAVNHDECSSHGVNAISNESLNKFGYLPENYGKYQKDWTDVPIPPEPPVPPEPPTPPPPVPDKPWWKKLLEWLMGLLK